MLNPSYLHSVTLIQDAMDWVHTPCGGDILSDGWTDGQVYWTCDKCGECWDDDDLFSQVRRKDFIGPASIS